MEHDLFLQYLRDHTIEEDRAYIQAYSAQIADHAAFGVLMKEEAQRQEQIAPFVALKLAELLIFFGGHVHHLPSRALGLIAKGNILKTIGYQQAAIECLDEAGEEFLRLGDEVGWARSRISWIISASWLGRVEDALQQAVRAHEVFHRYNQDYWACVIDHNIAVIHTQQGYYQQAIDIYERMLAIYPTLRNQSEQQISHHVAMARVNQSRCLALIGKFEEAYRLQMQAQEAFLALGEMYQVANTEFNLAEFDYAQGYYGSALRHYYRAHDNLKRYSTNDLLFPAQLDLQMADCLVKLNLAQEAYRLATKAVEISRQLGASLDSGELLRRYATTLRASGRIQEALVALNQAEELFRRGSFEHCASVAKLQRAEILLEMGAVSEAYQVALNVKKFFDNNRLVARSVRAGLIMGEALIERLQGEQELRQDLVEEATLLCDQALLQARQHNLRELVYMCHHVQGRLAALKGDRERAARHYVVAIAQVERILNDLAHDLSPAFLRTAWAVYEDLIALHLEQGRAEQALGLLERGRSQVLRQYLADPRATSSQKVMVGEQDVGVKIYQKSVAVLRLQRELGESQQTYRRYSTQLATLDAPLAPEADKEFIQTELKHYEARISELFERIQMQALDASMSSNAANNKRSVMQAVDIGQVQQYLGPGQLLLAYFLYRGRLVLFAVSRERLVKHEQPDGVEQLERLLPLLHAHLQPGGWRDPQRPLARVVLRLLQKLYDLLIMPVVGLLAPSSGSLTIVPYGLLHSVPFHALYDGAHFLVEDFQINYLPAASMIGLADSTPSELPELVGHAEGVGRPLVMGYSAKRDLPRALEEAKTLAELLNGRCYLNEDATIARLAEQAAGCPLIHLATHGQSRLDAPNFSSVLLADGPLNALDAFGLDLSGCELVTLSGCETGLALSGGGDEQLGLGRAFLAAGAASLVMSLWPVEDDATSTLMQRFYLRLLAGDNKAQALRAAQCSFLRNDAPDGQRYAHPYFWSAFRLVGAITPLRHTSENS